jgi:hypothetical protein
MATYSTEYDTEKWRDQLQFFCGMKSEGHFQMMDIERAETGAVGQNVI